MTIEDLQILKDSMQGSIDIDNASQKEEKRQVPKKTPKRAKKKKAPSPLPAEDMRELEHIFMGQQAAYSEPEFDAKSKSAKQEEYGEDIQHPINDQDVVSLKNQLDEIQDVLRRIDKKIDINNISTEEANEIRIDETPQPIEIVRLLAAELDSSDTVRYQLQTKEGIKEISLSHYYEMSKFVSMLQQFEYSMIVDKNIQFQNENYKLYKENLVVISQNILANSFRFFEKSDILEHSVSLGEEIKKELGFAGQAIDALSELFADMNAALLEIEYKKDFYFAKLLNERGFILNAITIINEMLGEYIVESSKMLSPLANQSIQRYLDNIQLSRSTRKAYYKFYRAAREFFVSHYGDNDKEPSSIFPFKDPGNDEISTKMNKIFTANKGSKSQYFKSYSSLIEKVRLIRNDLAHGNNSRAYGDITADIDDILTDFDYLAMRKDFLRGIVE